MKMEFSPSAIPQEDPSENLEKVQEDTSEETFQDYFESLRLTPEDFEKKILDVGAGQAEFAKWAKEHKVSSQIYSVDIRNVFASKDKAAIGSADKLPFADGSFDMVVSNGSMPHVLMGAPNGEAMARKSLEEMFRVTKDGGEIRLAYVGMREELDTERSFKETVEKTLKELGDKYNAQVEMIRDPANDIYHYEHPSGKRLELLAKTYFIVIHKPKNSAS